MERSQSYTTRLADMTEVSNIDSESLALFINGIQTVRPDISETHTLIRQFPISVGSTKYTWAWKPP